MKRIKKILCFCLAFTLVIASCFFVTNKNVASANSQVFYYNGTLYEDSSVFTNSISSFSKVSVTGVYTYTYHFTKSKPGLLFAFYNYTGSSGWFEDNDIYINFGGSGSSDTNVFFWCVHLYGSGRLMVNNQRGSTSQLIVEINNSWVIDFTMDVSFGYYHELPNGTLELVPNTLVISDSEYDYADFVDFNSSAMNYLNFTANGYFDLIQQAIISSSDVSSIELSPINMWGRHNGSSSFTHYTFSSKSVSNTFFPNLNRFTNFSSSLSISNVYFSVNRPVLRVNNTLSLYVLDYFSFPSLVDKVVYSLSRDNDQYIITYDGDLSSSRFQYIFNEQVQNSLFDTYIVVNFYCSLSSSYSSFTKTFSIPFGLKFNYQYYTPPLVSSNGVYNYTFNKPSYVDGSISFSIAPPKLSIPVLAWVENIIIFLSFYCPITSDVISLLHLDLFLGGLINVLNFFINSGVGDFILSCLAFLLYYFVLKSLLPSIVSSGGVVYSNSQFAYNRRRNKQERNKIKAQNREERYQKKLEKVNDKRRHKVN